MGLMQDWSRRTLRWLVPVGAILLGYWLLPISGTVLILPGHASESLWPRFAVETASSGPGGTALVTVTDVEPWSFVQLLVDGTPAEIQGEAVARAGTWAWTWRFREPDAPGYRLSFYHDCHTGCQERGRLAIGVPALIQPAGLPTKLGVVMANPDRDWHDRSGWVVEVAYARRPEDPYWGIDDLASRVALHHAKGLRVLIRVDYEQQQSLPPTDDYVALAEYLAYVRRLFRDDRLGNVYGFIIGSDYNTRDASAAAPNNATSPEWYARIFNGFGEEPTHIDNVVQIARAENPQTRIIVGPLRPWANDQAGTFAYDGPDVAWLRYMNDLVAHLDEAAQTKAAAGVPLVAPDGFDIQAPGNPDAPEVSDALRADEPQQDLSRESWDGAQAGFGVYRDWMAIINAYPTTEGLPIYIVSTNTYNRAGDIPPAQNYPVGWLTAALDVVNREPQIKALVWFLDDFPHSNEWDWFSLTERPGRLVDAAEEFDRLLRR